MDALTPHRPNARGDIAHSRGDDVIYLDITPWPLHDIAIANIVWSMAYKRGVGGGAYIAQWSCNSIATG